MIRNETPTQQFGFLTPSRRVLLASSNQLKQKHLRIGHRSGPRGLAISVDCLDAECHKSVRPAVSTLSIAEDEPEHPELSRCACFETLMSSATNTTDATSTTRSEERQRIEPVFGLGRTWAKDRSRRQRAPDPGVTECGLCDSQPTERRPAPPAAVRCGGFRSSTTSRTAATDRRWSCRRSAR